MKTVFVRKLHQMLRVQFCHEVQYQQFEFYHLFLFSNRYSTKPETSCKLFDILGNGLEYKQQPEAFGSKNQSCTLWAPPQRPFHTGNVTCCVLKYSFLLISDRRDKRFLLHRAKHSENAPARKWVAWSEINTAQLWPWLSVMYIHVTNRNTECR